MHKIYVEFAISGTVMVEEAEKDKVMAEMSGLIAKFMKNKNVVKLDNNFEVVDDDDFISYITEVGEA